jgi:16S rRNA (cytidine1402-2'-O)-methyltransferase
MRAEPVYCPTSGKKRRVGTLYIVATPIGNREDITLRALRVLREVAVVAAEDTRHTGQLLAHYGIAARYLSLHEHNERERVADIVAHLDAGDDVALVSDAGTPLLADPGARIVAAAREAGHPVVPIPGPSALLAAVVSSGIVPGPFTFVGFLPPKRVARRSVLESLRALPHPVVCYEAPHRLAAMLADAFDVLGDRPCALCRELTKLHEEVAVTTLGAALEGLKTKPARGEYVVIITEAPASAPVVADDDDVTALLYSLLASGLSPAAAAKAAAAATGVDRAACYKRAVAVKQRTAGRSRAEGRPPQ